MPNHPRPCAIPRPCRALFFEYRHITVKSEPKPVRARLFSSFFLSQLRKVNSTVHLTGKQSDQTKDAVRRLLEPPRRQVGVIVAKTCGGGAVDSVVCRFLRGPALRSRETRSDLAFDSPREYVDFFILTSFAASGLKW